MPKFTFVKGETSLIIIVFIHDDTVTDGSGLAGLDETSNIAGSYIKRNGLGIAVAVDEDVAVEGTYQAPSNAAHIRIGKPANSINGVYEFHLHNDQLTIEDYVNINLDGAVDMAPLLSEVQLTNFNLNDASPQVTVLDIVANAITAASINAAALSSAKFAADFLTNALIADNAFNTEQFTGDFLTNALIADNAFAAEQFAANFLTAAKINAAAFTTAKFAADFLTNALIADNALNTEQFAADFLTNALIADNTLDTEQFANGALTVAKFATAYALASECTAARLGELDAANMPADLTAIGAQNIAILVDTAAIIVQNIAILVDTGAIGGQNVAILVDTAALLARLVGTILAGNHNAQGGDNFARLGAPAGASVSADILAMQGSLPPQVIRNAPFNNWKFIMRSNVDHVTGIPLAAVAATRQIDAGGFAPCANAVAEIGFGAYRIDLAAADVNGGTILLRFTAAGCDDSWMKIITQI